MTTTYETEARQAKATKLADLLKRWTFNSEEVTNLDQEAWIAAAQLADVRIPSEKTKALVVELMAEREIQTLQDCLVTWHEARDRGNSTPWSYAEIVLTMDSEFHVARSVFDAFTADLNDETRCWHCGDTSNVMTDGNCETCGCER